MVASTVLVIVIHFSSFRFPIHPSIYSFTEETELVLVFLPGFTFQLRVDHATLRVRSERTTE